MKFRKLFEATGWMPRGDGVNIDYKEIDKYYEMRLKLSNFLRKMENSGFDVYLTEYVANYPGTSESISGGIEFVASSEDEATKYCKDITKIIGKKYGVNYVIDEEYDNDNPVGYVYWNKTKF